MCYCILRNALLAARCDNKFYYVKFSMSTSCATKITCMRIKQKKSRRSLHSDSLITYSMLTYNSPLCSRSLKSIAEKTCVLHNVFPFSPLLSCFKQGHILNYDDNDEGHAMHCGSETTRCVGIVWF